MFCMFERIHSVVLVLFSLKLATRQRNDICACINSGFVYLVCSVVAVKLVKCFFLVDVL